LSRAAEDHLFLEAAIDRGPGAHPHSVPARSRRAHQRAPYSGLLSGDLRRGSWPRDRPWHGIHRFIARVTNGEWRWLDLLFAIRYSPFAIPMFEGFTRSEIRTSGARIVTVRGGNGPPLLLMHGNPFSHLSWHKVAPRLAQEFTVVATDLRGYGDSEKPPG